MNNKFNKKIWNVWIEEKDSKIIEQELKGNTNWGIISQILIKYAKKGLLEKR